MMKQTAKIIPLTLPADRRRAAPAQPYCAARLAGDHRHRRHRRVQHRRADGVFDPLLLTPGV